MPENIRISVVGVPYTTERYVYFAGNRKASCVYKKYDICILLRSQLNYLTGSLSWNRQK